VAELRARNAALADALADAQREAAAAERCAAAAAARADVGRALHAVDSATQLFRRHVVGLPPSSSALATTSASGGGGGFLGEGPVTELFYERDQDVIGRGGCATVYRWNGGNPAVDAAASDSPRGSGVGRGVGAGASQHPWAVKVDSISYHYATSSSASRSASPSASGSSAVMGGRSGSAGAGGTTGGAFEPERCADLLPALLPPHPNVLAPKAWWVGRLPSVMGAAPVATADTPPGNSSNRASPGAGSQAAGSLSGRAARGFKLFTLYDRFPCSLAEHLHSLAAARVQREDAGTGAGQGSVSQVFPLLGVRSMLRVVADVAAALAHLEAHRVVHCDLKVRAWCVVGQECLGREVVRVWGTLPSVDVVGVCEG
jgi:hypothetical protein